MDESRCHRLRCSPGSGDQPVTALVQFRTGLKPDGIKRTVISTLLGRVDCNLFVPYLEKETFCFCFHIIGSKSGGTGGGGGGRGGTCPLKKISNTQKVPFFF